MQSRFLKHTYTQNNVHDAHFDGLVQVIQQKEWVGNSFINSMILV